MRRSAAGGRRAGGGIGLVPGRAALLALLLVGRAAVADPAVHAVGSIGLTVDDAERSAAFFEAVLDFERVRDVELAGPEIEHLQGVFPARLRILTLRLGDEELELLDYLAPESRPYPADSRGNDRWFQHVAIAVSDMQRAYARLRAHGVAHVSPGPQRLPDWNPDAGGIEAFYFRDPDGHFLELIRFPAGKGAPRWQAADPLFLGIDHTAIAVADTEASLRFYRDLLGLRVAGTSENHGPEQERLNGVFGARLRITTLRAASGPGIELLEYRSPGDGRPRPEGVRASDVLHWQTHLAVANLGGLERALFASGASFDSPGIVSLPDDTQGFRRAFLVADPDGHRLRMAEGLPR